MTKLPNHFFDQEYEMSSDECADYDARTLRGLAEAERGEGCSLEEFKQRITREGLAELSRGGDVPAEKTSL